MKVIHYAVCSPTNAFFFFFFFFFFKNQQPATLGFTAGKNNRFPAINKNPGHCTMIAPCGSQQNIYL